MPDEDAGFGGGGEFWAVCGYICVYGYAVVVGECGALVAFHSFRFGSRCSRLIRCRSWDRDEGKVLEEITE